VALLALLRVLPSAAPGPTPEPLHPADGQRPNLVLLLGDDHPHDLLGCAGHPVLRTPALDRLAATGTRFRRALVSTPICAAARATLLTGRTERAHGYTFTRPPLDEGLRRESLPRLLRDAGYRVGLVGKLGVNLGPGGAGELFEELHPGTAPYLARDAAGEALPHLTERNAEHAVAFLRAEDPRPFCLFLWFQAPHAEDANPEQFVWPAEEDALYRDGELPPLPATAEPAFFEALPDFLRTGLNRERFHWRFDTPEKRERMTRGYYRLLTAMDRAVGRVLEALEEEGLAERTVVVYTGDNGYFLGERGYAGKWTMHERSVRVPLLVRDPRLPRDRRGVTLDALVSHLDLPPTLLELAGVPVPAAMQGRSLLPLLRGEAPAWREELFTEHLWDHPRLPRTEGLRTERWKYIRYLEHPEYEELYDLEADPHEARNLAGAPEHAGRLADLRARCDAAAVAAGGEAPR
jgi:arylsulfatase A-like enzyme